MAITSSPTTFTDIHPLIIQTHILPRLDGQSLSSAATTSSYLRSITADDILWYNICRSTWPSITHPRVHQLISTFPAGHRSFFQDSFQPPITVFKQPNHRHHPDCSLTNDPWPSELISAVDIHYGGEFVYSTVEVTDTTTDQFRSSALKIELKNAPEVTGIKPTPIGVNVDELVDADDATMSHLKESMMLDWILIHPTRKRAINLSSIKHVLAWIANDDIHLRYVVVLPGCGSHETVECRIELALGVGKGGVGLYVRDVTLRLQDVGCNDLSGKEFLVISSRAFLEKDSTRRTGVEGDGSFQRKCVTNDETMMSTFVGHSYGTLKLSLLLCFCFLNILISVVNMM